MSSCVLTTPPSGIGRRRTEMKRPSARWTICETSWPKLATPSATNLRGVDVAVSTPWRHAPPGSGAASCPASPAPGRGRRSRQSAGWRTSRRCSASNRHRPCDMLLMAALKRVFWASSSSSRCFRSLFWRASRALRASRSVMSSCVTTQPPSALGWTRGGDDPPIGELVGRYGSRACWPTRAASRARRRRHRGRRRDPWPCDAPRSRAASCLA